MRRRLVLIAPVVAAAVVGSAAPPGWAAWPVSGTGPAQAQAATVPQGATPVVTATGALTARIFTLSWTTGYVAGQPATGYLITRTSSQLGSELVSDGTCAGTSVTLGGTSTLVYTPPGPSSPQQSCTDSSLLVLGTVTYTITPVYGQWVGTASAASVPTS